MLKRKTTWVEVASEDFEAAKILFNNDHLALAMYHCQQSIEKSFKAYLHFRKEPIRKTHDLIVLLGACYDFDPGFAQFVIHARSLKPFATKSRYPDDYFVPTLDDAKKYLDYTQEILLFVKTQIGKN